MVQRRFWSRQNKLLAPKLTITRAQPWFVKLALFALLAGFAAGVAVWAYQLGRNFAFGPKFDAGQISELKEKVEKLTGERDKLQAMANTIESQNNIDRAMQKQLTDQIKTLTADNLKLKDDLAFFESLLPAATGPEGITVQRIKAEMAAPGQLRYRVLVMQGGKGSRDFSGEMQFTLTLSQGGKPVMMQFPDPRSGEAAKLKLSFRYYQRLEGVIPVPEGASVKAVQARVLDKGQLRAQQAVNL